MSEKQNARAALASHQTPSARFTLAEPGRTRSWLGGEPASLLVDNDYDPAVDTLSDGPINTLLDEASQNGIITGPAGWSIRFHFALDEADDDGSIMWSADHDATPLRVASGWEPARMLGGFDRRGIDAAYDVLETAVAAANACLAQLHSYASRRDDR